MNETVEDIQAEVAVFRDKLRGWTEKGVSNILHAGWLFASAGTSEGNQNEIFSLACLIGSDVRWCVDRYVDRGIQIAVFREDAFSGGRLRSSEVIPWWVISATEQEIVEYVEANK